MTRKSKLLSTFAATLALLAACDGSDGVMGNASSQFGNQFAAAFNAKSTAAAKDDPNLVITYKGVTALDVSSNLMDADSVPLHLATLKRLKGKICGFCFSFSECISFSPFKQCFGLTTTPL